MPNYKVFFRLIILLTICFFAVNIFAAWLDDVAVSVEQPDGTVLNLFVTGDEFHRWVHDENGFTIIQNHETGYWTWAVLENDTLVPSDYYVHTHTPESIGLTANINISEESYMQRRESWDIVSRSDQNRLPSIGTANNIIIFIRFSDQTEFPGTFSSFDNDFNSEVAGVNSVYNYFLDASYNQLHLKSHFYPAPNGNVIVSYQDPNPRSYYVIGSGGATTGNIDSRFHTMLRNAVLHIASQVPTNLIIDSDNDGEVDNVIFIIRGGPALHDSDLLWPHKWYLYYATQPTINGKRVFLYNVNLEQNGGYFTQGVGVYAHELTHSLGAPDFYRYSYAGITPLGAWCLMASTSNPGQSITAYTKQKYLNWITIPTITYSGQYTISPLSTHPHAFRIDSPGAINNQHFVVEYRRNTGTGLITDQNLTGSGLVVYRARGGLNEGNRNGPPDELYVYRPNGTLTVNGTINNAFFSSGSGRTSITDNTNPNSFVYTNTGGTNSGPGGLNITNIGAAGETISFTVTIPSSPTAVFNPARNFTATAGDGYVDLTWQAPATQLNSTLTGYRITRNGTAIPGTFTDLSHRDISVTNGTSYTYAIVAVWANPNGESSQVSAPAVTPETQVTFNPPQNFVATAGNALVELSWTAPVTQTTATFTGYRLYKNGTALPNTINDLSFTDINVNNDVTYNYSISALYSNPTGESPLVHAPPVTPSGPALLPARDLSSTVDTNIVLLNWLPPEAAIVETAFTHAGAPYYNVGDTDFPPNSGWMPLQRFTATHLENFGAVGKELTHITFRTGSDVPNLEVFVCGWYGPSFAAFTPNFNSAPIWQSAGATGSFTPNTDYQIELNNPILIQPGNELVIGFRAIYRGGVNAPAFRPFMVDFGPALAGFGNLSGGSSFTTSTLDYNHIVGGIVSGYEGRSQIAISHNSDSSNISYFARNSENSANIELTKIINEPATIEITNLPSATQSFDYNIYLSENISQTRNSAVFIGYNVYRNDVLLNTSPIAFLSYIDLNVPNGTQNYSVRAVYEEGLSAPITTSITVSVVYIDDFPYSNSFEISTFPPPSWRIVDYDGDSHNWYRMINGTTPTTFQDFARTGTAVAASRSWLDNIVGALSPDNWLITARIDLPENNDNNKTFVLNYWVRINNTLYPENYSVYISTAGNTVSSFETPVLTEIMGSNIWVERTIDLSEYEGESFYIAFRHHNSVDKEILAIDDFWIGLIDLPAPPNNLIAEVDDSIVNLSWEAPDSSIEPTGYIVHRDGSPLSSIITDLVYEDTDVINGTTYAYFVTAEYSTGVSLASDIVYATPFVLNTPQNFIAELDRYDVILSWEAPSVIYSAIIGYDIYRDDELLVTETDELSFIDTNLTPDTYIYKIATVYEIGYSPFVSFEITIEPLLPPRNLSVEVENKDITLNWLAPETIGESFISYTIYRDDIVIEDDYSLLNYTDIGLSVGDYVYSVSAWYEHGESERINSSQISIILTPPHPVTLISPENNATDIDINTDFTWSLSVTGGDITDLAFYISQNENDMGSPITLNANAVSFNPATILEYDTTYYWTVIPSNSDGPAENNQVFNFTTAVYIMPDYFALDKYEIDFGDIEISATEIISFSITNLLNTEPIEISISLENDTYDVFDFDENISLNKTISANETVYIDIIFTPDEPIYYNAKIIVSLINNNDQYSKELNLVGHGFNVDILPPEPVILLTPENDQSDITIAPIFTWEATGTNIDGFRFYITEDINQWGTADFIENDKDSYILSSPLEYNTTYYWRVIPFNEGGSASQNTVFVFTTMELPVPFAVILMTPANEATDIDLFPEFSWNYAWYPGVITYLHFYISEDEDDMGSPIILDLVGGNFVLENELSYFTTYFWQVIPGNETGDAVNNSKYSFTTIKEPAAPSPVTLLSPIDDSDEISLTPQFSWSLPIETEIINGLRFYLSDDENIWENHIDLDNDTTDYIHETPLEYETFYFWKVIAFNDIGDSENNQIFSFKTIPEPGPTTPILTIEPDFIVFDDTTVGDESESVYITLKNIGIGTIQIFEYAFEDDIITGDFTVNLPSDPYLALIANSGSSIVISVSFTPQSDGEKAAKYYVYTDLPTSPHLIEFSGLALAKPEPIFNITPDDQQITFDETDTGHLSAPISFVISNTGNADLVLNNLSISNPVFTFIETPEWSNPISPNNNISFEIIFNPELDIDYEASFTISGNFEGSPYIIELRGKGRFVSDDDQNEIPVQTELIGNFPNPFNPETAIKFNLEKSGSVNIEIYNIRGQKIRTLMDANLNSGLHTVTWNGKDDNGRFVSTGMYFYKLETEDYFSMKRMILLN